VELDTYVLLKAHDFSGKKRPYVTILDERSEMQAFPKKSKKEFTPD